MNSEPTEQSSYDRLPEKVVVEAYLEEQRRELLSGVGLLDEQIAQLDADLRQEFQAGTDQLMTDDTLDHDSFLEAYETLLLNLNSRDLRHELFADMLTIRESLQPGVPLYHGKRISFIAQPDDESDLNFGIKPIIIEDKNRRTLGWSVPVEAGKEFEVRSNTVVGRAAILKEVESKAGRIIGARNADVWQLALDVPYALSLYQKLGADDEADALKREITGRIKGFFSEEVFRHSSSFVSLDITRLTVYLELCKELDTDTYSGFIDTAKEHAATGAYPAVVSEIVKRYISLEALSKDQAGVQPHPQQVYAETYLSFVKEGRALIEARQASE